MEEIPQFDVFEDFTAKNENASTGVDNLLACYVNH